MARWQPIETAPRDGAVVLACEIDRGKRVVYSAKHEQSYWDKECGIPARWHLSDLVWHDESDECDPTHWMPLPAPPGSP
jgi:hypothetical protein